MFSLVAKSSRYTCPPKLRMTSLTSSSISSSFLTYIQKNSEQLYTQPNQAIEGLHEKILRPKPLCGICATSSQLKVRQLRHGKQALQKYKLSIRKIPEKPRAKEREVIKTWKPLYCAKPTYLDNILGGGSGTHSENNLLLSIFST